MKQTDDIRGKEVTRVIRLTETEWKWLCDWMGQLLKIIGIEEMTADSLRMGAIYKTLCDAKREDEETGAGELQVPIREK